MFISQNSSNRVPLQSVSPPTTVDTWPHLKEQISFCDGSLKCDQKSISGLHYICASIGAKDTYHTSHFCSLQSSTQGKTVHHSPPSSPNNTLCCQENFPIGKKLSDQYQGDFFLFCDQCVCDILLLSSGGQRRECHICLSGQAFITEYI